MWIEIVLAVALVAAPAARASGGARGACVACHSGWEALGKDHPPVKGADIAACLRCHALSTAAEPNRFATRLHRAHATTAECRVCHLVGRDGRFGLAGTKTVLGRVSDRGARLRAVTTSWAGSALLDAEHGRRDIACGGCHGADLPDLGSDVGRERCLACHGPEDALVQRTAPAIHPDRNPHRSHLGPIECTVCHRAHSASEVYCLGCHPKWEMKVPGRP